MGAINTITSLSFFITPCETAQKKHKKAQKNYGLLSKVSFQNFTAP